MTNTLPDAQTVRMVPKGYTTFRDIRQEGGLYVDKTDLVHKLAHDGKYVYLSRPKRFGKSVLVDTFDCYWRGEAWLFEGLKIMELETEWTPHYVVRLDMSRAGATCERLETYLDSRLSEHEEALGVPPSGGALKVAYGERLMRILRAGHERMGCGVVVLVDEYDCALQRAWGTPEYEACVALYRDFFTTLKAEAQHLKWVFITGIARFSFVGIFSSFNNLNNISFLPQYSYICGLTEKEIRATYGPELKALAKENKMTVKGLVEELRNRYDGYYFNLRQKEGVFNPYCVLIVLGNRCFDDQTAAVGAAEAIHKFVKHDIKVTDYDDCSEFQSTLQNSDLSEGNGIVALYQTGFLTIKGEAPDERYRLGFPTERIRTLLYRQVLPGLLELDSQTIYTLQQRLAQAMEEADIPALKPLFTALLASVPFHHIDKLAIKYEERYALALATILGSLGFETQQEVVCATGLTDLVSKTRGHIYVCECKLRGNGGLAQAAQQLRDKAYHKQFAADKRDLFALALEFDDNARGLLDMQLVDLTTND